MKCLLVVIALVGCSASDSDYPVLVQGGTSGNNGAIEVAGNICLLGNIEVLTSCAAAGAGGLVVSIDGVSAVTADNGTFVIHNVLATPGSMVVVTGSNVIPSAQVVDATNVVPVISSELFDQVLAANSISLEPNVGSIIASVVNASGEPLQGITATSTPASESGPFFDSTTGTLSTTSTGAQGIVFFPGLVPPGPVTLTVNTSNPTDQSTISDVRVLEGGVSFVNAELSQ